MRVLLLLLVVAIGADAILYSGSHTQSAWRVASNAFERLTNERAGDQQRTEIRP